MSYIRVLPRDLFNEANLLKCLGQLWIAVDGKAPAAQFDVEAVEEGFWIDQDPNDGSLRVVNLPFSMGGRNALLTRPLNSREPWPLYISFPEYPEIDTTAVFNEDGSLSHEFTLLMITA